jgi:hypothetical protein
MQLEDITDDMAYFERAFMHGSCSYVIRDLHGDWYIEVSDFNALEHPEDIELEYELTDEEKAEIRYLIEDHIIQNNIIEELTDPANYYDEDEWRYTC